jgi:hypothetical protein
MAKLLAADDGLEVMLGRAGRPLGAVMMSALLELLATFMLLLSEVDAEKMVGLAADGKIGDDIV